MRRAAATVAFAALLAVPGAFAADGWRGDAEAAASWDTNAGNSRSDDDKRETSRTFLAGGLTREWRTSDSTALQARIAASGESVGAIPELANGGVSLRGRLLHKPGHGFYVPVLGLSAAAGYREYDSSIRDGVETRVAAQLTEPLTTAIQARLELGWQRRKAAGRAFDGDQRTVALDLDWRLPLFTLYAGTRLDRGAVVVSTPGVVTPKSEHLYLEPRADAIEPDDAFGDEWNAFRLDGRTLLLDLGANVPLSGMLALDASVRRAEASAAGFTYERWIATLALLARF